MTKLATVGVVSLGCAKNQVDTEIMLGYLTQAGYELVTNPQDADVIIVNTCGFITSAKEESISAILEMAQYKKDRCKTLVVTGCLSQRYDALSAELPEVDLFLGVNEYDTLVDKLNGSAQRQLQKSRVLTTPPYTAFLRIADGCDNRCSYCAIPIIRGNYKSAPAETLLSEAQTLVNGGVKELILIAQDTTRYGRDCGGPGIAELIRSLEQIDGLNWIRLMYTYPSDVTDELLETVAASQKALNYLDIPIQHVNERILSRMNRRGTSADIARLVKKARAIDPLFALRTSIIVGFPGESEAEFAELLSFIEENPFDRIGAFAYSQEEDTPAAGYSSQLPEALKRRRLETLMKAQATISQSLLARRVNTITEVLVEGRLPDGAYYGRSYAEAPDVDGKVIFTSNRGHTPGEFVSVKLTNSGEYDIYGEAQQ